LVAPILGLAPRGVNGPDARRGARRQAHATLAAFTIVSTHVSADNVLPDYDELERALFALGEMSAAEAHGVIAGLLRAPRPSADVWARTLFADVDPAADNAEAERLLGALRAQTQTWLAARESEFVPLLPSTERSLDAQVAALADFCRGYVVGLVAGGMREFAGLPADAREIIEDFMKIAEAEVEDRTAETEAQAFTELTEYVRVGVQLIYEELHSTD
jgi:uncharacterized protein YgfB (UPF0149 family)